jgi:hypothetical protein
LRRYRNKLKYLVTIKYQKKLEDKNYETRIDCPSPWLRVGENN